MNGPEHYREAERLADRAHHYTYGDGADPTTGAALAAEAQVHATLAAAAASVEQAAVTALAHDINSRAIDDWSTVLGDAVAGPPAQPETETATTYAFRAEHPDSGITLGHYATAAAARAHCEDMERRSWPTGTTLAFDWIEDDGDRVAELVVTAGQNEESTTGYTVTALELASAYDEEADV
ncbi:hypothetical protein ACVHNB_32650 [Streptomyces sp. YJ-C3]